MMVKFGQMKRVVMVVSVMRGPQGVPRTSLLNYLQERWPGEWQEAIQSALEEGFLDRRRDGNLILKSSGLPPPSSVDNLGERVETDKRSPGSRDVNGSEEEEPLSNVRSHRRKRSCRRHNDSLKKVRRHSPHGRVRRSGPRRFPSRKAGNGRREEDSSRNAHSYRRKRSCLRRNDSQRKVRKPHGPVRKSYPRRFPSRTVVNGRREEFSLRNVRSHRIKRSRRRQSDSLRKVSHGRVRKSGPRRSQKGKEKSDEAHPRSSRNNPMGDSVQQGSKSTTSTSSVDEAEGDLERSYLRMTKGIPLENSAQQGSAASTAIGNTRHEKEGPEVPGPSLGLSETNGMDY